MNRAWLRSGKAVMLAAAVGLVEQRAKACTPVNGLTPASVVWPTAGAVLDEGSWVLFRQREAVAFVTTDVPGGNVALELEQALSPLRPSAAPLAFYRPKPPLVTGRRYTLEGDGGRLSVPFTVSADAPRVAASIRVSVRERMVPQQSLSSASCYTGPLADRPYTRVADVVVASVPDTRFVVLLDTLDSLTGELIEDAALHDEGDAARLELPMPPRIADCLRVRVWDFSGTLIANEGSLCVNPEGDVREVQASVFVPTPPPPAPQPEPNPEEGEAVNEPAPGAPVTSPPSRTSKGCQLSGHGSASSAAGIFGLGWLLLARRRSRR